MHHQKNQHILKDQKAEKTIREVVQQRASIYTMRQQQKETRRVAG